MLSHSILLGCCLLLLSFTTGYDLQEWLTNRAIQATGSWASSPLGTWFNDNCYASGGCVAYLGKRCVVNDDCNMRLGTPVATSASNAWFSANVMYAKLVQVSCTGLSNLECLSILWTMPEDACIGFNVDPNSGLECGTSVRYYWVQGVQYYYQTFVDYPDMRCIENKCAHLEPAIPGYSKDYCMSDFRYAVNGGSCPDPNNICSTTFSTANKVAKISTGGPVQAGLQTVQGSGSRGIIPCQALGIPQCAPTSDASSFEIGPRSWGFLDPWLLISTDPRDTVSTCTCFSNSNCAAGQICDLYQKYDGGGFASTLDGQCWCSSSGQCTSRGGGTQVCLTNSYINNIMTPVRQVNGGIASLGKCSCLVGLEDSCNYNGICKPTQDLFPRTPIPTFYTIESFGSNANPPAVPSGRCECYGKVLLANSQNIYNETVLGSACEHDSYRDIRCAGHGNPLCVGIDGNGQPVFSKNNGGFLGYRCNKDAFDRRGAFICQCDQGWAPDSNLDNPNILPCSFKVKCSATLNSVFVNGQCECSGTTYSDGNGHCLEDCSGAKSANRGQCFYNIKYLTSSVSSAYNNDVRCTTPGWRTLYDPNDADVDAFGLCTSPPCRYYATFFNRGTQEAPAIRWIRLSDTDSHFCNVPFNEITGKVCGEGTWSAAYQICNCDSANGRAGIRDNANQLVAIYAPQPYCATICIPLTSTMADLATPSEYNGLACGGPKRGTCVSNGLGGQRCACVNGYTGLACQTAVCHRARGRMCGGTGICDHATGNCVCSFGFHGLACEFRANDCAASQPVLSYPLPVNNVVGDL